MGLYRMEYLKDVVDYFIIVESNLTFTGREKELYSRRNETILNELRSMNKIVEVIVDLSVVSNENNHGKNDTDSAMNWDREIYLRNYALKIINQFTNNRKFILLVCDADEIPRKEYVRRFPQMYDEIGNGMRLVMISTIYNFHWSYARGFARDNNWYFPYIITDAGIRNRNASLQDMRVEQHRYGHYDAHMEGWLALQVNELVIYIHRYLKAT